MMHIRLTTGDRVFEAELNQTETAKAIAGVLPIEFSGSVWGDEIYGEISISPANDETTLQIEVGDLGYWPPGRAFCIFYGPTPASVDEKPVPASEVILIGRILGDATTLRGSKPGTVYLEALET